MTNPTLERAARAVHETMSKQDVLAYLDGKFEPREIARAVLMAVRKSEHLQVKRNVVFIEGDTGFGMYRDLRFVEDDHTPEPHAYGEKTYFEATTHVLWRGMIDAILGENDDNA